MYLRWDPRYEMDADEWRHTTWSGADGLHSAEGARATVTARNNTNTTVMQ